ncbi:MAG: dihydropyrimidinase [Gemmatimonadales bacterium]|jgi:dihydropyrimidinase
MRTLIRHGIVVTPEGVRALDVLVDGERIGRIAESMTADADRTVDAAGKYVLPGGIDVHTHLDMPYGDTVTSDDFATGTAAAACGGTTCVVDFAVQTAGRPLREALDVWHRKAEGKAAVDYGFHMIVCDAGPSLEGEMDALVAEGVPSFKLFTAYPGRLMVDDAAIFRSLRHSAANGATVMIHAENGGVIEVLVREALAAGRTAPREHARTRPALAEAEAAHRVIALAEMAGAPVYVVHVSTAEAAREIATARERGVSVFGETCPQYLLLSDELYDGPAFEGAKYVMSPPLRDRRAQERLWRALAAGEIQVVATDHCPFRMSDQKALGRDDFTKIPGGAPGIETRMSLLFDAGVRGGRFGIERFVELTATQPARLFGLWPRKGALTPGADADLLVWDPERTLTLRAATLHMQVDYSPFEGRVVTGAPELVLSRGRVVAESGRFVGRPGAGAFVRRTPRAT